VQVRAWHTAPRIPTLLALPARALRWFVTGAAQLCRAWSSPSRVEQAGFYLQGKRCPADPS
jgi:hypothetical protein